MNTSPILVHLSIVMLFTFPAQGYAVMLVLSFMTIVNLSTHTIVTRFRLNCTPVKDLCASKRRYTLDLHN